MSVNDVFYDLLPKIDLHGFDRDSARVAVMDFVDENYLMGNEKIVIIHGVGTGIVKAAVHEELSKNNKVLSFHIIRENIGCTLVSLIRRN